VGNLILGLEGICGHFDFKIRGHLRAGKRAFVGILILGLEGICGHFDFNIRGHLQAL
jgi:hypothetical protein